MKNKNELIMVLSEGFGKSAILTRKEVIEYLDSKDMLGEVASAGAMTRFLGQNMEKVGYGKYQLPSTNGSKKLQLQRLKNLL